MQDTSQKTKKNQVLSLVLLSHRSGHFRKGYLEHSITSLARQSYQNFEVILLDNNTYRTKVPLSISDNVDQTVFTGNNFPIGIARNMGAKVAKGEVIVFLDDDTFLVDINTLSKLNIFSQSNTHGYGAKRFWTYPPGFFEANSTLYLEKLREGDKDWLLNKERAFLPQGLERVSGQKELYHFTFPGNFCFVRRDTFFDVGGYDPSFKEYGCEDDYFGYRLYRNNPLGFKLLSEDVSVLHVNHPITGGKFVYDKGLTKNRGVYKKLLAKDGIRAFNVNVLFNLPNYKGELVIE